MYLLAYNFYTNCLVAAMTYFVRKKQSTESFVPDVGEAVKSDLALALPQQYGVDVDIPQVGPAAEVVDKAARGENVQGGYLFDS